MKIFTVVHDFRGGGAEKVAVLLANEWRGQGFDSEIVCVSEAGPFRERVASDVSVRCLNKSLAYAAIPSLASLLAANREAIVISHLTHMNVVCLLAASLAGHRRVHVVEHNDFSKSIKDTKSMITRFGFHLAPWLYRSAGRVVCVSDSVLESLPRSGFSKLANSCVVSNPVDPSDVADISTEVELHPFFSGQAPVLVGCGRLTEQKNYDLMLHAFRLVLDRMPVKLLVLGEGVERERLEASARSLGVAEDVDFLGFRKDAAAFFSKARLFVSTSLWEGLPMTMIEALFAGANLVVTNSCSDASVLVNCGRFGACVDSFDALGFADAVVAELGKPVASLSDKREFLARFSLPRIASQYISVFDSAHGAPVNEGSVGFL